jgi:transcriptional regulator with XRE-family HTH domain
MDALMALERQEIQERVVRVFERQDVLDACRQRTIGPIITALRRHGVSQGLMSTMTGIPQGRVSEYERNVRQPTLETFEKFATGMGIPDEAQRALGLTPTDHQHSASATTSATDQAAPDLLTLSWMAGSLNTHVDRRSVLHLASTLVAAPLLGVEESVERLGYALIAPVALQEDTVHFLEQRTVGLHRIEELFSARLVHRAVTSHLREVTALLEGHVDDPLRPRLARIAGESAVLAAWTAWDLNESAHSARMYRVTEVAARVANDPVIVACATTYRSYATSGPTAHEDARKLLAEARRHLPDKGEDATRAWVQGREAEEAAAIGDHTADDLIKQATEAYNRSRPQTERPWTRFLDQTRMHALELSTYTRLGNEPKVHQLADELIATSTSESKRLALINADVGLASVRLGDVTSAISYGRNSLQAVRESETSFGLWRLEELARALAQEPGAAELRAEIKHARQALASPL